MVTLSIYFRLCGLDSGGTERLTTLRVYFTLYRKGNENDTGFAQTQDLGG